MAQQATAMVAVIASVRKSVRDDARDERTPA
jgi:hypothetical protein